MPIDPRWNEITCLIGQIKGGIKRAEYQIPSDSWFLPLHSIPRFLDLYHTEKNKRGF